MNTIESVSVSTRPAMIFSPLISKMLRSRNPDVRAFDISSKSWTVDPAREGVCREAIFDPDDLARITGFSGYTTREQEMGRLVPHTFVRRATMVSELEDAVLCGGNLYSGSFKHTMREKRKLFSRITAEVEDGGIPCSSWFGGLYFGHWLADDTALKLLAAPFGTPTELQFPMTPHQEAYNELFGIRKRLLPDDCLVRKVTLIETDLCSDFRAQGWQIMKSRIDAAYPPQPHIGCMLLRGASGLKRLLVNETEIAELLRARGFRIVDPATASLDELLKAASGSRLIVGVEGSHLAHGFHCLSEGGAMVSLQPPNRLSCMDKERCDAKKVRYAISIGYLEPNGFRIDIDSLLRLIDRVIAELKPFSAAGLH